MIKQSGIYKITCISNNKIYIGSSIFIGKRWSSHISALNLRKHENPILQRAWNKYGKNNFKFEIIEIIKPELLMENELKWFKITNCCDSKYGFNIIIKPGFGMYGRKHSKRTRIKISESNKGKKRTDEQRQKLRISHLGHITSEDTKQKMRIARKKQIITKEHKIKIGNSNKGKKHTKASKLKMSKSHTGKILSKETRFKIGQKHKGKKVSMKAKYNMSNAQRKRYNKTITFNGKTKYLIDWAIKLKIKYSTLLYRIFTANWSIKKAFIPPIRTGKCK